MPGTKPDVPVSANSPSIESAAGITRRQAVKTAGKAPCACGGPRLVVVLAQRRIVERRRTTVTAIDPGRPAKSWRASPGKTQDCYVSVPRECQAG